VVNQPDGVLRSMALADLLALPVASLADCLIVSTGHGVSGPFTFAGVRLLDLLHTVGWTDQGWQHVDASSADGFGTRLFAHELSAPDGARPILLSYRLNGAPMTRAQGLVRLIVPSETDDALRQVKWVARLYIHAA
jgi:DMSO/TMAO reductase YedYZ molybdopterin-dependent catalytic subunit